MSQHRFSTDIVTEAQTYIVTETDIVTETPYIIF